MTDPAHQPASGSALAFLCRWLVLAIVAWTCLTMAVWVIGKGYVPRDDTLRHVAKAISGRDWQEVLVMRPDVTLDQHPGWHWLLGRIAHTWAVRPGQLVAISVMLLSAAVLTMPLWVISRPEAWLAAVWLAVLAEPLWLVRLLLGRPFLVSMAALLLVCVSWRRLAAPQCSRGPLAVMAALLAVATWMHGSSYLWALPLLAFGCARQWRGLRRLAIVTLIGIAAGASLTGHPLLFLWQGVEHGLRSVGGDSPSYLLVGEFQPSNGSLPFLVSAGVLLLAMGRCRPSAEWSRNPVLWLAVLGWTLGLGSQRFWFDWGLPAAVVSVAFAIEAWLVDTPTLPRLATLGATVLLAVGFTLTASADHGRRWSNEIWRLYAPVFAPQNRTWLPDTGGVLYNTDMNIFYLGLYLNPRLDYRFQVGFEPTLLPDQELSRLREIQRRGVTDDALRPWVTRLRPIDRIAVLRSGPPPALNTLEWFSPMPGVWLGRIPTRTRAPAPSSGAAPAPRQ